MLKIYRWGDFSNSVSLYKNNGEIITVEGEEVQRFLMEILEKKTILVGHEVSFDEARNDPEFVQPNSYALHTDYGSFSSASKHVWAELSRKLSRLEPNPFKAIRVGPYETSVIG